jgi:hypothetical protein
MITLSRRQSLTIMALLAMVVLLGLVPRAEAATGKASIVGAWYVDTVGAPFEPHGITFHADGTLDLTNPDAAEATNSSSAGMGSWVQTPKGSARGRFFEVNADKTTNQFTSLLVVTFEFTVNGDTFSGPASASYFDGNRNLIAGPFPATLKGQRFAVDGPVPDPLVP